MLNLLVHRIRSYYIWFYLENHSAISFADINLEQSLTDANLDLLREGLDLAIRSSKHAIDKSASITRPGGLRSQKLQYSDSRRPPRNHSLDYALTRAA